MSNSTSEIHQSQSGSALPAPIIQRSLFRALEKTNASTTSELPNKIWSRAVTDQYFVSSKGTIEFDPLSDISDRHGDIEISNIIVYSPMNILNTIDQNSTSKNSTFESLCHEIDIFLNQYRVQYRDRVPVTVVIRTNHWFIGSLQEEMLQNAKLDQYLELKGTIKSFKSLKRNWDGDGAEEIPESAIETSLKFLELVYQLPRGEGAMYVAPSPDGEIVFYWNCNDFYAEVNFDGTEKIIFCWKEEDEEMQLIEEDVNVMFEVEVGWVDKSLVWGKLYSLLCRGF